MLDRDTGEIVERIVKHEGTAVRDFYAGLAPPILVGIERLDPWAGSCG